ncbi:MAG: signal peptidase I [Candidatus Omnitrophica bacterium]|nr:signal peptidase I [Candidatus Omnitrophota bacterium]
MQRDNDIHLKQEYGDLILIKAVGFSMWPFLKTGERVVVKKVAAGSLRVGDIILYRAENQIVCHRLVKIIKNKGGCLLYARGDNNLSSGEPVAEELLVGKVTGVLRNGHIISLAGRRSNFVNQLIVVVGPLFGIGSRIIKRALHKT